MSSGGFSFLDLYQIYLRLIYRSNGLQEQQVHLDSDTLMQVWAPQKPGLRGRVPLVLLHGFGAGATIQWDKQVSALSKHFDLYIPDLLFFGGSTTKRSERSEEFQAECVVKLLKHFGVLSFHLLGYSYGGAVSYMLAHKFPHAVNKLILLDVGIIFTQEDLDKALKRLGASGPDDFQPKDVQGVRRALKLAYYKPPRVPDFVLKEVLKKMFSEDSPEKQELRNGFKKRISSFKLEDVPKIDKTTLIIVGEFDPLFPPELAFKQQKFIGDISRLEVIPKTAHMPQAERPHLVNKEVLRFLLN